jgi:predicted DNA-binding transcriptional regulator
MTNSAYTPKVLSAHPALYAEHTFHMNKARKFTYNYVVIDEVLVECWNEMTIDEVAEALNEYRERVAYRVQVLKKLGMIKAKYTGKTKLLQEQRKLRVQLRKVEKQLDAISAA